MGRFDPLWVGLLFGFCCLLNCLVESWIELGHSMCTGQQKGTINDG